MEDAPWRTDRPLDTDLAADLVADQFPELRPVRARKFGEGWDSEVLLVNGRLVFTFPKREETLGAFVRGLDLLPILAAELPVRVPEILYRGEADERFPYPFAGYPLIAGRSGLDLAPPRSAWPRLAAELGAALTALHSIPLERLPDGLPAHGDSWDQGAMPKSMKEALRRELHDDRIEPFLYGEAEEPASYDGPKVFTHADMLDYHIILNPGGDGIAGIIDWFDAGTWDPCGDFVGIYLWLGPEFTELVISEYGGTVDDGFRDRIPFMAGITALWEYGSFLDPTSPADPDAGRRYVDWAFPPSR